MWILWPAFLAAGVLEVLVFALIDPQELHWNGLPLLWSREAVYTAAFFVFWGIAMAVDPPSQNENGEQPNTNYTNNTNNTNNDDDDDDATAFLYDCDSIRCVMGLSYMGGVALLTRSVGRGGGLWRVRRTRLQSR